MLRCLTHHQVCSLNDITSFILLIVVCIGRLKDNCAWKIIMSSPVRGIGMARRDLLFQPAIDLLWCLSAFIQGEFARKCLLGSVFHCVYLFIDVLKNIWFYFIFLSRNFCCKIFDILHVHLIPFSCYWKH